MRSLSSMLGVVRSLVVVVGMLVGANLRADTRKPPVVVARVVGLEISDDTALITIAAGSEQGIGKTWRAQFREGNTQKPLAGGEAIVIRVDHRSTILKTSLPPAQIRANRFVQLTVAPR